MIIPDVNILVYAYDGTSPFHRKSKVWWEDLVNSGQSIGLPWEVILGFLQLITSPKVFSNPTPVQDALSIVDGWLSQPSVSTLDPGAAHWRVLSELLSKVQVGAKLVADAHLCAIAREHRATMATNDRDFERFAGVVLLNPLSS